MESKTSAIENGAMNLLKICAGISEHDSLLIVREKPGTGYYDDAIAGAVAEAGRKSGADVTLHEVAFDPFVTEFSQELARLMKAAHKTVFFARIADQLRFSHIEPKSLTIVSYALDIDMLASAYGTADYCAFKLLREALNDMLCSAKSIYVTCPAGTEFCGSGTGSGASQQGVDLLRFPMPVVTPIPAAQFSGSVVLPGFLVGTGSKYYEPYAVEYDGKLIAHFEESRIVRFTGDAAAIRTAENHYSYVSKMFDIDHDFVHSWHMGIHPGCSFLPSARSNFARWSGAAFGNPRLLHFHTCGAYAPGEISWNVLDPTVVIDGVTVWDKGILKPDLVPGGREILEKYPSARQVFDTPSRHVGL